jgi:pimeloyl-ACP methyl ester carboxylesterase
VDDDGPIVLPVPEDGYVLSDGDVRLRGWGEVHADSYSGLLYALQTRLNQTFGFNDINKTRFVKQHWKKLMTLDPQTRGMNIEPLTESHLERHAQHYFPAYAVGYNWLEDCASSSLRLEQRILEIIESWKNAKRTCSKVILITHSMGGLVARACAKRIPDKIAGVIHGVMPALGAPAVYRRLACGTEAFSPRNGAMEDLNGVAIAKILGDTTEKTTPVLATAAGALELLPNHLYPQPWLHIRVMMSSGLHPATHGGRGDTVQHREVPVDYLHMPTAKVSNPYDLYRDMKSWYRMINPLLADPAGMYRRQAGGVENAIKTALAAAEKFHRSLGDYYHPNTYAFYGIDPDKLAYGQLRWSAPQRTGAALALTSANLAAARNIGNAPGGARRVIVEEKSHLQFEPEPQESAGDGTVPHQSGAGPADKIKQIFATRGYDHQGAYNDEHMLMLTLRLIVRIVQELS